MSRKQTSDKVYLLICKRIYQRIYQRIYDAFKMHYNAIFVKPGFPK